MPESRDQIGHLLRALERQQMAGTAFYLYAGSGIDDRVRSALPLFAQVAVGAADDDQRGHIEIPDFSRPVLPAAAFEPSEPGLAR